MTRPPEANSESCSRWYEGGLRFTCTRCGECCTGSGTVRVDNAEQQAIAAHLGISSATLRKHYLRRLPDGADTLIEKPNEDCIFFLRGEGCSIYEQRPRQCRTWPFWRGNIATRRHWKSAAASCPGMNQGAHHTANEIESTAAQDGTSGIVPDLT